MASKSSTATRRPAESDHGQPSAQTFQQFADLTEKSANLFKEIEAVQQIHQHSAQRTALKLQQAAEQLRSSTSSTELLSIQSTLMMGGLQELVQYTQEMSVTLLRLQVALVPRHPLGRAAERNTASGVEDGVPSPISSASTTQDAASAATAAVFQSWSNMLGGALSPVDGRAHH